MEVRMASAYADLDFTFCKVRTSSEHRCEQLHTLLFHGCLCVAGSSSRYSAEHAKPIYRGRKKLCRFYERLNKILGGGAQNMFICI